MKGKRENRREGRGEERKGIERHVCVYSEQARQEEDIFYRRRLREALRCCYGCCCWPCDGWYR